MRVTLLTAMMSIPLATMATTRPLAEGNDDKDNEYAHNGDIAANDDKFVC
jgi:hypothetical protein